ncbi:MAG: LysM peptidoglycan-binding domain-containing protein [Limisphaerales bacterium]
MSLWTRILFLAVTVCVSAALSGCLPDQGQSDEEKEPHYVLGQSRVNSMDYQGAAEAFEESLEVNPHSAQAHYQLAMLYDTKLTDPAAAIYHYQEYLKFDPDAANAAIVRQRIEACKQQLAADVLALPSSSATQQQLEKLIEQNRQLQDEVDKWQAYYASQQAALTNQPYTQIPEPTQEVSQPLQSQPQIVADQQPLPESHPETHAETHKPEAFVTPLPGAASRTHMVVAGETAMAISRHFGIRLNELQAANPGVNLSRIRVGEVLKIP